MSADIKFDFPLKNLTFFKVGGPCKVFFTPRSIEDLQKFLEETPQKSIICLGAMSNVLIPDEGFDGCVVSLCDSFNGIKFHGEEFVEVEAGVALPRFINECVKKGLGCAEQMFCIPGTIGGALVMNAGTPKFSIFDVLEEIRGVNFKGKSLTFRKNELNYEYRHGGIPCDFIITSCLLKTRSVFRLDLERDILGIKKKRLQTQPIGAKTCGSTFKNPPGQKAWQLIDSAGCRRMRSGGAVVSDLHCNFIVNEGAATSADILNLIKMIKDKVFAKHGIVLEEEIKIIRRT